MSSRLSGLPMSRRRQSIGGLAGARGLMTFFRLEGHEGDIAIEDGRADGVL